MSDQGIFCCLIGQNSLSQQASESKVVSHFDGEISRQKSTNEKNIIKNVSKCSGSGSIKKSLQKKKFSNFSKSPPPKIFKEQIKTNNFNDYQIQFNPNQQYYPQKIIKYQTLKINQQNQNYLQLQPIRHFSTNQNYLNPIQNKNTFSKNKQNTSRLPNRETALSYGCGSQVVKNSQNSDGSFIKERQPQNQGIATIFREDTKTVNSVIWQSHDREPKVEQSIILVNFFNKVPKSSEFSYFTDYINGNK